MKIWKRGGSDPVLMDIVDTFMIKNLGETRISIIHDKIEDPSTKIDTIAFEGSVAEPGNNYTNRWQFRFVDTAVWGRPKGGGALVLNGKYTRLKKGEWIPTPWVPQEAIDAVMKAV